jgi:hypothetical protein
MKKAHFSLLLVIAALFFGVNKSHAQFKIGVFDVDAMVTAMPAYATVDSLLDIYEKDTLAAEYEMFANEYNRLDSTLKYIDTPGLKTGAVKETKLKYDNDQKTQMYATLINWRQIAQRKYNNKKAYLSQALYQLVTSSYEKILKTKGYVFVAKPGSYEYGTRIDNLFISVARDLKLKSLPQELVVLGIDPETPPQGQVQPKTGAANRPASH